MLGSVRHKQILGVSFLNNLEAMQAAGLIFTDVFLYIAVCVKHENSWLAVSAKINVSVIRHVHTTVSVA